MSKETLQLMIEFLTAKGAEFEHFTHEHVHTSEDAAKIRGNTLSQAAKAIILKVRDKKNKLPEEGGLPGQRPEYRFIQVVLPGHRKIDMKLLKSLLELDSASLASPEDVLEKTGCSIGSVPPFGKLFGIDTFVDGAVLENETIFFSAGTHNDSMKMKSKDYVAALNPQVISVSM